MDYLRGVRSKVFTANVQLETQPTLLYDVFLTPSSVGTAGIIRCYDGESTEGEFIAEFHSSYDFGASPSHAIQFKRGLYIDMVSGLSSFTICWLTNEQLVAMWHDEQTLQRLHDEKPELGYRELIELLGVH